MQSNMGFNILAWTFNDNKTPELLPSTIRLIPVFNFLPSVENVTSYLNAIKDIGKVFGLWL